MRDRLGRDERGAAAIVMALSLTLILVAAGLVLDFGIIRLDRQGNKLAADDAVAAGLQFADGGSADVFTQRAVCGALQFLRSNKTELSGLADSFCTAGWASSLKVCNKANPNAATSAADYQQSTVSGGVTYTVEIKSPYQLSEGSFPEESLATLATDPSKMNGCDQLAVIITEARKPGFGSLVTSGNITTSVRSVGRFSLRPGPRAPALLLLERHSCSVLTVGSSGVGTGSSIRVDATGNTPGTIHADSDATGTDCGSGSNQQLFQGKQANGIQAGASGVEQGYITSVAAFQQVPDATVYDTLSNVHSLKPDGTQVAPSGMSIVTRNPADERYAAAIRSSLSSAASIWALNPNNPPSPWVRVGCNPNNSQVTAMANMTLADWLYVDCPGNSGITWGSGTAPMILGAGRVVFNGFIKGGGLSMPNAASVYVSNTDNNGSTVSADAINISGSDAFCVRGLACTTVNPTASLCPTTASAGSAKLYVRQGYLKQTGGLLRLCHTTLILLGGRDDGCVPATNGTAPTTTPCNGGSGNGQLTVNGGMQDWTAPNEYAGAIPKSDQASAWGNLEDLALWAESAASTNDKYTMGGGGQMYVVGVYMTPNAIPFQLNGGASQGLINAQFIASTFSVGGNSHLTMTVDPDNTVPLPRLSMSLVR
jgi:Flp pilus assembly protein TadG